jgi:hypothetical protein
MSNLTFKASLRAGGRGSCAPGKRRISATISEAAFLALRSRAHASHRGLSGEAADIIERAVATPEGIQQ